MHRKADGSAGDVDYGRSGTHYSTFRRPEPRIAQLIAFHLGDADTVLNVGAGAGSYEPVDRNVTAVEPSATMRTQRPSHLSPAIDAVAEDLPFEDNAFDAGMATFTIHQWNNLAAGLREMRRVTRGPVILLSCEPGEVEQFWLKDYAPGVLAAEARRYPSGKTIEDAIGDRVSVYEVPIPFDCVDGFNEAYYGRPEMFLNSDARLSCSAWGFISPAETNQAILHLKNDLDNGTWDEKFGTLRLQPFYLGSLKLYVAG